MVLTLASATWWGRINNCVVLLAFSLLPAATHKVPLALQDSDLLLYLPHSSALCSFQSVGAWEWVSGFVPPVSAPQQASCMSSPPLSIFLAPSLDLPEISPSPVWTQVWASPVMLLWHPIHMLPVQGALVLLFGNSLGFMSSSGYEPNTAQSLGHLCCNTQPIL